MQRRTLLRHEDSSRTRRPHRRPRPFLARRIRPEAVSRKVYFRGHGFPHDPFSGPHEDAHNLLDLLYASTSLLWW